MVLSPLLYTCRVFIVAIVAASVSVAFATATQAQSLGQTALGPQAREHGDVLPQSPTVPADNIAAPQPSPTPQAKPATDSKADQQAGSPPQSQATPDQKAADQQQPSQTPGDPAQPGAAAQGKQPKRILFFLPNYRAVSANTTLPRLSVKNKFWLATQDTFDYSAFILTGFVAGISQAKGSTPEFGQGALGYFRYYWHAKADQSVGNYFSEAIMPSITHQDPRYYTLGHGTPIKRVAYSMSRLFVTKTDSGKTTFNISEIAGNAAGAGVSDLYYPRQERSLANTGKKWGTQVLLDGLGTVVKEFWPDISRALFHGHI
jgi:hypothetical protein